MKLSKSAYLSLYLLVVIILSSCSSGKKSYEQGNYYDAVITAVNRLRRNTDNKKSSETLRSAYPMAVRYYEDKANAAISSNVQFKWKEVVQHYTTLQSMHDEIQRSPGALRVIPNPTNYQAKLSDARQKAAEESYNAGIMALGAGDRASAKNAYYLFINASEYAPGYRDVAKKIEEARWAATVKVAVDPIPVVAKNYALDAHYFDSKLNEFLQANKTNEFIKFYRAADAQAQNIRPDHIVQLSFEEFSIGQVYVNEKESQVERDSIVVAYTYTDTKGSLLQQQTEAPKIIPAVGVATTVSTTSSKAESSPNTKVGTPDNNTTATTPTTTPATNSTTTTSQTVTNNQSTTSNTQTSTTTQTTNPNTNTTTSTTQTSTPDTQSTTSNTQTSTTSTQTTNPDTKTTTSTTQTTTPDTNSAAANTQTTTTTTQTTNPDTNTTTSTTQTTTTTTQTTDDKTQGKNGNPSENKNTDNGGDKKEEQVTICHQPPGKPDERKTMTVPQSAVKAHLAHGDVMGECKSEKNENKNDDEGKNNKGNEGAAGMASRMSIDNSIPVMIASASNDNLWYLFGGQDAMVDTIKVYGKVKATVRHFKKTITSRGVLNFRIIDARTKAVISEERMPSESIWISEWLSYNGDSRALSPEQTKLAAQRELPPPTNQDLFTEFSRPLFDQIVNKVTQFYKNY